MIPPDGATQLFDIVIAAAGYTPGQVRTVLIGNAVLPVNLEARRRSAASCG